MGKDSMKTQDVFHVSFFRPYKCRLTALLTVQPHRLPTRVSGGARGHSPSLLVARRGRDAGHYKQADTRYRRDDKLWNLCWLCSLCSMHIALLKWSWFLAQRVVTGQTELATIVILGDSLLAAIGVSTSLLATGRLGG